MPKYFGRQYRIEIGDGEEAWILDSRDQLYPLQIMFDIETSYNNAFSTMDLVIVNLNKESIGQIVQNETIRFQAGYPNLFGTVFTGKIMNLQAPRQNVTERILQLFCWSGLKETRAAPAKVSFGPGTRYSEIVDSIAFDIFDKPPKYIGFGQAFQDAMGTAIGGYNALQSHKTLLDNLGDEFNFQWMIENDTVILIENGKNNQSAPYLLNASTGLVGGVSLTWLGADLEMKLNPNIGIGDRLRIESESTTINFSAIYNMNLPKNKTTIGDGVYTVMALNRKGDFYADNSWSSEFTCWREGETGVLNA